MRIWHLKNFNSDCVFRWRVYIDEYSPHLQHVKGEEKVVVDVLIRLPLVVPRQHTSRRLHRDLCTNHILQDWKSGTSTKRFRRILVKIARCIDRQTRASTGTIGHAVGVFTVSWSTFVKQIRETNFDMIGRKWLKIKNHLTKIISRKSLHENHLTEPKSVRESNFRTKTDLKFQSPFRGVWVVLVYVCTYK